MLVSNRDMMPLLKILTHLGANGVFAETILDIAKRKPHLIFTDGKPYHV